MDVIHELYHLMLMITCPKWRGSFFVSAGVVIVQGIEISGGQGRAHRVTTIGDESGKGRGRQRSTKRRGVDSFDPPKKWPLCSQTLHQFFNMVCYPATFTQFLTSLAFLSRNILCWVYLWLYALKTCSLQSILAKKFIMIYLFVV